MIKAILVIGHLIIGELFLVAKSTFLRDASSFGKAL